MMDCKSKRLQVGFTLIELMIVISIVAIAITLVAPSFRDLVKSNRLRTETNKFVSALNLAKSEAVKRNSDVVICNGSACTDKLQEGWQLFSDPDLNGTPSTGEEVIRVSDGLATGFTLTTTDEPDDAFIGSIVFRPDGSVSAASAKTFIICPPDRDDSAAWGVTLNLVGSPTIKAGGAGTCPS